MSFPKHKTTEDTDSVKKFVLLNRPPTMSVCYSKYLIAIGKSFFIQINPVNNFFDNSIWLKVLNTVQITKSFLIKRHWMFPSALLNSVFVPKTVEARCLSNLI